MAFKESRKEDPWKPGDTILDTWRRASIPKRIGIATGAFAIVVGGISIGVSSSSNPATNASQPAIADAPSATAAPAHVARATNPPSTPKPTAEPTEPPTPKPRTRLDEKRDFIATVDESISGARIAGNPRKFIGANVDLHGQLASIIDETHFNLSTGGVTADDDGNVSDTSGIVVVECASTVQLEKGQALRVLGTVIEPAEGTNGFGGAITSGQVHAEFME